MTLNREEILELCAKDPDAIVTILQRQEEIIERQNQTIAALTERIVQLEARIAELESRLNQNRRNSNRPPSTDGFRRPKSQRKKGERSPGGQKGHKGRTLEWVEVPDLIEVHQGTTCEGCGESLENHEPITTEQRQVHDIPPMKLVVTEHRVEH
jgi:transposase